jgi:hypothetical protein
MRPVLITCQPSDLHASKYKRKETQWLKVDDDLKYITVASENVNEEKM